MADCVVHGLGGAGEALQIRCQNKGLDGLNIQRSHGFPSISGSNH
jgi:hypothetical protein